MSFAVVTSCTGADYHQWLVPWARHVESLTTKPDQVVVATDVDEDLMDEVDEFLQVLWVVPRTIARTHPAVIVNDAIDFTHTDWICRLDVDDIIYPRAYEHLEDCDADVYALGYFHDGSEHHAPAGLTADDLLRRTDNPLAACSPFRRWLWEAQPYRDMLFDDWAFWIDAAKAGATFAASPTIDYEYRRHPGMSTARLDTALAHAQIAAIR